ncbi:MAG TPA: sigma-70 family RNA polymerase sigma factor [Jiangellaceae bacterium]
MSRRDETSTADGEAFASVLMAARANAPWAFERLFATYAPRVKAYVQTNGAVEPDEITNDVFLAAFQALAKFEGDEPGFRSWLFTIARRRVIDEHRKRSRRVVAVATEQPAEMDGAGGDVEAEALENITSQWVVEVLNQLSADQRDVLLLRTVADCTIEQIAGILGKRPGAVKALQRRGLAAAKKILAQQGVPLAQAADV